MPGWLTTLSHVSPIEWGIAALEGAIWRGFTLSEMLLPCGVLVAVAVVAFGAGTWVFRRAEA